MTTATGKSSRAPGDARTPDTRHVASSDICHQMELRVAAEEDGGMVSCEMEAVEALAALARCAAVRGGGGGNSGSESPACQKEPSQDQAIADFRGNASSMVTSALKTEETVRIEPHKLCSTSYLSNSASKSRKNLTEAEKEARRLRRVLANRESARQTIRRRQAMHLELTRKAANLSEGNENLKKEKELATKEYNSLKGRNEFLKMLMANVTKGEPRGMQEATKSSQAEIAASATTSSPVFLYNQPSLVPYFWPFIPPSNVIQLQHASHSDAMSLSQFSPRTRDISSSHPGQEISLGITGPGNPLYVLPVPWLLPFPGCGSALHSYSDTNKRRDEIPSTRQCSMSLSSDTRFVEDNHESSTCARSMSVGSAIRAGFTYPVDSCDHQPKVTLLVPEKLSCIRPVESIRTTRRSQEDGTWNLNAVSATEHIPTTILKKNLDQIICCRKKPGNIFAATKARKRRKELMKLKNIQHHHVRSHSANR